MGSLVAAGNARKPLHIEQKGREVSRYRQYVQFLLVLAVLATAAVTFGSEPWGPW